MSNPFKLTNRSVDSILRALREFGYVSLTRDEVIKALVKLENKEDVRGDIIAMFIKRDLEDAGVLK